MRFAACMAVRRCALLIEQNHFVFKGCDSAIIVSIVLCKKCARQVTSSFYRVSNYWTAFLCSVIGASYTYVLTSISPTTLLLFQTQFPEDQEAFTTWELFVFMCIGLVGAFLSVFLQVPLFANASENNLRFQETRRFQKILYLLRTPLQIAYGPTVCFMFEEILSQYVAFTDLRLQLGGTSMAEL